MDKKDKVLRRRALVDLDIITVNLWDREGENKKIADEFIKKIEKREFLIITPFSLLEIVTKWKNDALKDDIEEFYIKNSHEILSNKDVDKRIKLLNIDDIKILKDLEKRGVKGEDALLVLITSIFKIDYLVTFNRKHLRNKEGEINQVLREDGLEAIKIIGPEMI